QAGTSEALRQEAAVAGKDAVGELVPRARNSNPSALQQTGIEWACGPIVDLLADCRRCLCLGPDDGCTLASSAPRLDATLQPSHNDVEWSRSQYLRTAKSWPRRPNLPLMPKQFQCWCAWRGTGTERKSCRRAADGHIQWCV